MTPNAIATPPAATARKSPAPVPATRPGLGALPAADGTSFRVWAPNAEQVHVTGSFNGWADPGVVMVAEEGGVWSAHCPQAKAGDRYRFRISRDGQSILKVDPRARQIDPESRDGIIYDDTFDWQGSVYETPPLNEIVLYEIHVGTFCRATSGGIPGGSFRKVIDRLPYLKDLGVNAIELMPPTEFPGATSWGYNPCNPFAVESQLWRPRRPEGTHP